MQATFWSNTIWFILLGITSIISTVFVLYKSNNRKFTIGFILAVLGATFFAETVILTSLNAYKYLPKIFGNSFLDSISGNYFSQFSLTITAALVIVYKLPVIWDFILAGIYCLIEELFIKLGIYGHNWYKTWYTFILVLSLLYLSRKWYYHMVNNPKPVIYYFSLFLGASAAFSVTVIFFLYAFSIEVFNIQFIFNEYYRNQAVFIVAYRSLWIIIMIIINRLCLNWLWKCGIFLFLFLAQYILLSIGLISIKNGWFFVVALANLFGSYIWAVVTDHLLSKGTMTTRKNKPVQANR